MAVVLVVVGSDRSGSTLVDNMLGSVPGVFSMGEVCYLWDRGMSQRRLCGCGQPVPECPVWSRVISRLPAESRDASDVQRRLELVRTRHLLTARLPIVGPGHRRDLRALADVVAPVYDAVFAVTGANVIVDSSKRPTWARLLASCSRLDVRVLHLVRDPRAVAHSRKRYKLQPDSDVRRSMTRARPATSAMFWTAWNVAGEHLCREVPSLRVRYEDLMADPAAAIGQVLRLCDLDSAHPTLQKDSIELATSHTVSGNPSRFAAGSVKLRLDDAWRRDQSAVDRVVVDLLTAPLAWRYGYRGGMLASYRRSVEGRQQINR